MLLAVAAIVGALTGCSPGNWPTIAVRIVDGAPAALAQPCPSDKLTLLLVTEVGGGGDPADWPQWRVQGERPLGAGETVRLLSTPDDWRNTRSEISAIEPGHTYSVEAWGAQISFNVEFTVADLRDLGPDQVWGTTDGKDSGPLPRPKFERAAAEHCDR